jgi:hypothetical protein
VSTLVLRSRWQRLEFNDGPLLLPSDIGAIFGLLKNRLSRIVDTAHLPE